MTDEIIECKDPNGVPFAETNNYVDRRWAMKMIAEKDARIAELEVLVKSAYEEGWFDAAPCSQHPQQSATQFEKDWMTSLARAALDGEKL